MPDPSFNSAEDPRLALRVVNQLPAKVSYWDTALRCRFANEAYLEWYGRSPAQMAGIPMRELYGPAYESVRPHVEAALAGRKQVFERPILLPNGTRRDGIVTFMPDLAGTAVSGFTVHVADITALRQREASLAETIREVIQILEKTRDSFRSRELGQLRQRLNDVLNSPKVG